VSFRDRSWSDRFLRALVVVTIAWAGFWSCAVAFDDDRREHLMGDGVRTRIDVLDVERGTSCGSRTWQWVVTYRRVDEGDLGTTTVCRTSLDRGLRDAWVIDEEVHLDSPARDRTWLVVVPLLTAALVATLGGRSVRSRRR
jgi:hypothetical protein